MSRISYDRKGRFHSFFIDSTCLDCPICCTHTTADISTLEGRTSRTCTTHHEIRVTKYQFTIGSKVDKQGKFRFIPQHADQCTRSDISTHITSDIRSYNYVCIRIHCQTKVRCIQRICLIECRYIRFHTNRICIHSGKQMIHSCISGNTHTVDLFIREFCRTTHLLNQRIDCFINNRFLQTASSARFCRFDDSVDNICSITDLTISWRCFPKDITTYHIDQQCGYCCSTDINSKSADHYFSIFRKNIIDKNIALASCSSDHTANRKISFPQHICHLADYSIWKNHMFCLHLFFQCTHQPFIIRHGIFQRRSIHGNIYHFHIVFQNDSRRLNICFGIVKNSYFFRGT